MSHLDDEQIALLTMEGYHILTPEAAAHLESCERCRQEIETYLAVVDALREPIELETPPEDVWARIAAELDGDTDADADQAESDPEQGAPVTGREPTLGVPGGSSSPVLGAAAPTAQHAESGATKGDSGELAPVIPLRPRASAESRWVRRLAFAAAASFALGAASTAVLSQFINRPSTEILQSIGLEPLPGWEDEGSATLEVVNGERVLVIDLPEIEMDGFREVWLIDRNVERLVSLGTMNGDRAAFPIPDGLDLEDYVVVDVSQEHFDGDPTHSGESIVRGVLS